MKSRITFTLSKVTVESEGEQTILELAEAHNVPIDSQCRQGVCGTCKVKLLRGEVTMTGAEALTEQEIKDGYILACVARPKTAEVDIEA